MGCYLSPFLELGKEKVQFSFRQNSGCGRSLSKIKLWQIMTAISFSFSKWEREEIAAVSYGRTQAIEEKVRKGQLYNPKKLLRIVTAVSFLFSNWEREETATIHQEQMEGMEEILQWITTAISFSFSKRERKEIIFFPLLFWSNLGHERKSEKGRSSIQTQTQISHFQFQQNHNKYWLLHLSPYLENGKEKI